MDREREHRTAHGRKPGTDKLRLIDNEGEGEKRSGEKKETISNETDGNILVVEKKRST